jgi:DNA repair photolyase
VAAVAKLNEAGVPCGVLVAPVLPGLSDSPEQIEDVVKACVEAGAVSITPLLLHLRAGVREHYMGWLEGARPDLVARYRELYPKAYAPAKRQDDLAATVRALVERHGGRSVPPRAARAVKVKPPPAVAAPAVRQLDLGV